MGRDALVLVPELDLDAYAARVAQSKLSRGHTGAKSRSDPSSSTKSSSSPIEVFRWCKEPKVLLIAFADAGAQRRALGRLSMFMEDPDFRGTVAETLPSGVRGGVANYSGHNARVRETCAFVNEAANSGTGAWAEERALVEALVKVGIVRREKTGEFTVVEDSKWTRGWDGGGWNDAEEENVVPETCLIAVCASENASEVQDALLHEAMHGLWYAREDHARWCYDYYRSDALTEDERATWVEFLRELRYDVTSFEVVVNEFQAYMATERVLFGPDAQARGSKRSSASAVDALTEMQKKFARAASEHVSDPPRCGTLRVVWE
jgi:hypothetical protein